MSIDTLIDTVSIHAILTNTIRYRYGIDTSGIEAEPGSCIASMTSLRAFEGFADTEIKVVAVRGELDASGDWFCVKTVLGTVCEGI